MLTYLSYRRSTIDVLMSEAVDGVIVHPEAIEDMRGICIKSAILASR